MNDKEREAILADLVAFTTPPRVEADEFLVEDLLGYCKAHGVSREDGKPMNRETIRYRLDKMIELGYVTKRKVLHKRKRPFAYKLTDKFDGQGNLYDALME